MEVVKFSKMFKLDEMAKISLDADKDSVDNYIKTGKFGKNKNEAIMFAFAHWPVFSYERDKLEALDEYIGFYGYRNTKKDSIKVMFDTNSDKIKKGDIIEYNKDNESLWREIEIRNEAELCKLAMNEYDIVAPVVKDFYEKWAVWNKSSNKKLSENPLKEAVKALTSLASQGKTVHIDYMFLQACFGILGGAKGRGDGINILNKESYFGTLFMEQLGMGSNFSHKEKVQTIMEVGYYSFLLGKDLWGSHNENRVYADQFDDTGNLFDRNNRNSEIVHIVEQHEKNPFDIDKRLNFIVSKAIKGTRKYLDPRTDNKERFNKYALWLCKGRYSEEEIKEIMKQDFQKNATDELDDAALDNLVDTTWEEICTNDVPYIGEEWWTTTEPVNIIVEGASFATMNFNNSKKNILGAYIKNISATVKLWLGDKDRFNNRLDDKGEYIEDDELFDKLKKEYLDTLNRTYLHNAASMDASIGDEDGSTFGDTIADASVDIEANIHSEAEIKEIMDALDFVCDTLGKIHPENPRYFDFIISLLKYPFLDSLATIAKATPYAYYSKGQFGKKCQLTQGAAAWTGINWKEGTTNGKEAKNLGYLGFGPADFCEKLVFVMNNAWKLMSPIAAEKEYDSKYISSVYRFLPILFKRIYGVEYKDISKDASLKDFCTTADLALSHAMTNDNFNKLVDFSKSSAQEKNEKIHEIEGIGFQYLKPMDSVHWVKVDGNSFVKAKDDKERGKLETATFVNSERGLNRSDVARVRGADVNARRTASPVEETLAETLESIYNEATNLDKLC